MNTFNLVNFRDLGGLKTSCGKTVKHNRLLRAAQPVGLLSGDIEKLNKHGLKSIIDLRTTHEITKEPVDTIDGVDYTHIDVMGENSAQAADPKHWANMLDADPAKVELQFIETYKEFATSECSRRGYGVFLKACANLAEGSILFHCAAGKDRTGLAAAIILRLLRVADDDIYTDYLKTIEHQEQISSTHLEKAKAAGINEQQLNSMKILLGVKKEFLAAALSAAEEQYGSFENYLVDGLGVTPKEIEQIRDMYLE